MQTQLQSLVEANVNTWIGFIGSLLLTLAINTWLLPELGVLSASIVTTVVCTVWSIVRGYYVRRYFARRHHEHR